MRVLAFARRLVDRVRWKTRGVIVYSFVGGAGTGKSYRASAIAKKHGIDLIYDDGLLIHNGRIIAGKTAKKAGTRIGAIKRAILHDPRAADLIRRKLIETTFNKILVIGTSDEMVNLILSKMGLPAPRHVIRIEDVATPEDISEALYRREKEGKHVIPVPSIEIKSRWPHSWVESLRLLAGRGRVERTFERSIVRPFYGKNGRVTMTLEALELVIARIVDHESGGAARVTGIDIIDETNGYRFEIDIEVLFGENIPDVLSSLQAILAKRIEEMTGLDLDRVDLTAVGIFEEEERDD